MNAPVSLLQKVTALVLTGSLVVSAGVAYDKQRAIKQAHIRQKIAIIHAAENAARRAAGTPTISMAEWGFDESAENHKPCEAVSTPHEGFATCHSVDSNSVVKDTIGKLHNPIVPISDKAEVHVVGVYSRDLITVTVDYPQHPIVLVLTAYESVEWDIKVHPNTKIERLIISGYHAQRYRGIPESTPVEIYTSDRSRCSTPCWHREGHFYAHDLMSAQTRLDYQIERIIGKRMNSFQGAYKGDSFDINASTHKLIN